jgi:NAD(P)-dependent dehydrogenase (short-subunit alcohol dehydrogenase family)
MTATDHAGATALVTGATSGIGRAVARSLARRGAHVIVSGRDTAHGDQVVTAIRSTGGKAWSAEFGSSASSVWSSDWDRFWNRRSSSTGSWSVPGTVGFPAIGSAGDRRQSQWHT